MFLSSMLNTIWTSVPKAMTAALVPSGKKKEIKKEIKHDFAIQQQ